MKGILAFLVLLSITCALHAADAFSLAGRWRFGLDRADRGLAEKWYNRLLTQQIRLPGSLPEQGIGDDVTLQTQWMGTINDRSFFDAPQYAKDREPGHIRIPFWLQPEKYYSGVAWFQRDVDVLAAWIGRRTVLFLERPHWQTEIWIDGRIVGTNDSLAAPHQYDLGQLQPGKHTVSIRVDNRRIIDIGENSHCITDHTQGNWNGIVGRIELQSTPPTWISDVQVYPHLAAKSVTVKGSVGSCSGHAGNENIHLAVLQGKKTVASKDISVQTTTDGAEFEAEIPLGKNVETWDEFHPALYTLTAKLQGASRSVTFGMREISTQGTQFLINGRKTFIRGTLECCIFPKTGHPPTDVKEWKRILGVARSYGLNLLRFHSYCPPEAAFIAGDEMGFYFQVETCWANQSTTIGDGKPVDQWVYDETRRILKAYGNHPSFLLMPYGNEPGGTNATAYLAKYVEHFKAVDSRRLWTSGSGWPPLPENEFHITPEPRVQLWGAGLKSRINSKPPATTTDYRDYIDKRNIPVVSHEIGQWCAYPNFDEMPKYTGYLKPKNFDIFRDSLNENGMGRLAHRFLLASGKLQTLCYKEDIESALRTSGMGGFELLDLHDFPGQGTALVGVLDPFWEDKGYVTAREYSRFCNQTVPLARLTKRVFTTDEQLTASLEIANFGPKAIDGAVTKWSLVTDAGQIMAQGDLVPTYIPIGNGISLGNISIDLKDAPAPIHARLIVSVAGFENDWGIWIYPSKNVQPAPANLYLTSKFDSKAEEFLKDGGSVLLTIPGNDIFNYNSDPVKLGFSSIFWNTAWTGRQAPTTLGILCDPKHPAFAQFPTDYYNDWQWWYLIHRGGALRLDLLPANLDPIVRVIDDWVTARPLGLIVEGKAGRGRIVICGFDLTGKLDDPVSVQMLTSLKNYMGSRNFAPVAELTTSQIRSLAVPLRDHLDVAHITADSEQTGYEAKWAIDGDPETIWHTSWEGNPPGFPHSLIIQLTTAEKISGFTAQPRQDGNHNGWIKDYQLYASNDGINWGEPVAKGVFSSDAEVKTVKFSQPVIASFVKLVAMSGYANGPWASLAEINLLEAK